jgi:hypothetical protein
MAGRLRRPPLHRTPQIAPDGCRLWYDTTDISALREGEKERADTMQVLAGAASTPAAAAATLPGGLS